MRFFVFAFAILVPLACAAPPRDAVPIDAAEYPLNFRLHVEFSATSGGAVRFGESVSVPLPGAAEHDVAVEHPAQGAAVLRVWSAGKLVRGPEEVPGLSASGARDFPDSKMELGADLFITCRDQLVRLRDLNGDGEMDFIECFNDDAQVIEHFHEFAMGLQTDAAGNFYYAKSGRHAFDSVVPHHGTLLRVSADGSHTDILARVKLGGFYGNMFGFTKSHRAIMSICFELSSPFSPKACMRSLRFP